MCQFELPSCTAPSHLKFGLTRDKNTPASLPSRTPIIVKLTLEYPHVVTLKKQT
ncbi:hypothetical protein SNOG_07156 [Parastagonospora nodorum SN15]|uniref:Uncharacterized protein n=1 Tax=Phaeosphaeria nodorum (strain SN15 / ATCC MYA-4574 / FGSC 10173) TaxID=321614 RepID=Q0UM58_PHANO|nr:hypothetical protein SNOG_07156 [Parastagonospora nodorum SN15]EAT85807.1 hypothetical protein SNOG_07156 [Parastagonospora nodorum SN15]